MSDQKSIVDKAKNLLGIKKRTLLDRVLIVKEQVRIMKIRSKLFEDFPRLYRVMDYVDVICDCFTLPGKGELTMCVEPLMNGRYRMYWNPNFTKDLPDRVLSGIIKHEIMHILLKHTTTRRPFLKGIDVPTEQQVKDFFDKLSDEEKQKEMMKTQIWNLAIDIAINQFIEDDILIRDNKGNPTTRKFDYKDEDGKDVTITVDHEGLLPRDFPKLKLKPFQNAEYYYNIMMEEAEKFMEQMNQLIQRLLDDHDMWDKNMQKKRDKRKKGQSSGNQQSQDNQNDSGEPSTQDLEDLNEKKDGNSENADDQNDEAEETLDLIASETGIDTWNKCKVAGKGGVGKDTITLDIGCGHKKTPGWMKETKQAAIHGFDTIRMTTRKRPNRRFGNAFPGIRNYEVGNKVLVAVDVSGSIDMPLYKEFAAHCNELSKHAIFDIVFFNDSLILPDGTPISDGIKAIVPWKQNMHVRISGGTDFEPVILLWNNIHRKYDGMFIFTDGCASYSSTPKETRTLNWIVYNSSPEYTKSACRHGKIWPMKRTQQVR